MKSKQLVLIAIALLCGLVSAIGIIQAMGNKGEVAEKIPMGPVLVASADVDLKAELTEENVRLENWPLNLIPEGAATDLGEVDGMYILTRLRSGQAIILEDVRLLLNRTCDCASAVDRGISGVTRITAPGR